MLLKLSKLKENKWVMGILLGLLGFCITVLYTITDLFMFDAEVVIDVLKENGKVLFINIGISALMSFVFTLISYFIGQSFNKKLQIQDKKIENKRDKYIIACISIILPLVITLIDIKINPMQFSSNLGYNIYNFLVSIFNNGVIEEIWLRMGLFSLFYYGVNRIINKNKDEISSKLKIGVIIFISLLLMLFQLNVILNVYAYTFNFLVVLRLILYNLVLNLYFNYFYVYYGIKKSIFLHMLFVCVYTGLIPIVMCLVM